MWIRVLSEWSGSPKCGCVADVPDAMALDRIRGGWAEAVVVVARAVETAVSQDAVDVRATAGVGKRKRPR